MAKKTKFVVTEINTVTLPDKSTTDIPEQTNDFLENRDKITDLDFEEEENLQNFLNDVFFDVHSTEFLVNDLQKKNYVDCTELIKFSYRHYNNLIDQVAKLLQTSENHKFFKETVEMTVKKFFYILGTDKNEFSLKNIKNMSLFFRIHQKRQTDIAENQMKIDFND